MKKINLILLFVCINSKVEAGIFSSKESKNSNSTNKDLTGNAHEHGNNNPALVCSDDDMIKHFDQQYAKNAANNKTTKSANAHSKKRTARAKR